MAAIEDIRIRKILDSRGNETVEVDIETREGTGRAAAPSGASTGKNEAIAFKNQSVDETIDALRKEAIPRLIGVESSNQVQIDKKLKDLGGESFEKIGGNGAVAISLAAALTAASEKNMPLYRYIGGIFSTKPPFPLGNIVGGGAHSKKGTDIQEFLVAAEEADSVKTAVLANTYVHRLTGDKLEEKEGLSGGKGDEGAWISTLKAEEILETIKEACNEVEKKMGVEMGLGLDVAASELFNGESYVYSDGEKNVEEQINFMESLAEEFNLIYLEDPLHEEDFEGFAELSSKIETPVCGDDLFVTDSSRIERGASIGSGDVVLIKPNQVGTLTGTMEAVKAAKKNGYSTVASHRSGETTDTYLSHLATGFGTPLIKCGVTGGERTAKLNELLRIEEMIEGGF